MSDKSAVLNNQRLLDSYAKILYSCDVSAFTDVTEKLAIWLDNPKAYYTAVRHEIIKLLTIALSTIRRAVGVDSAERFHVSCYIEHPLVPPYVKLVQVVRQYINLFVEPDLAVQIRYLVSTVNLPPAIANSQEFRTEQAPVQASSVAAPRDTTPVKADTLASPSASPKMSSTNPPIQGVPQRIKRKRKTLEQLIDVDQRKLRENMTSIQPSLTPKEFKEPRVGSEESANVVPHANADSQPVSEFRPLEVPVSPSSMPTDATVGYSTPSRTLSVDRTIPTDGKITSTTAHLPQAEEHSSTFVKSEENQQSHKVLTEVTTVDDVVQLASTVTNAESIPSDSQVNTEYALSRDEAVAKSVQAGTLTSSEPVDQEGAGGDALQSSKDDSMDVEIIDEQLIGGRAILDGDEMELEHESPVQGQVVEKLQEIHDRLSQYASQVPFAYEDSSFTISKSIDQEDVASQNTETVDDFRAEHVSKVEHIEETIRQEKEGVPRSGMNSLSLVHPSFSMVKVPTLVRGLSNPGKVTIGFEIKPGVYAGLSRWARRDPPSTEFADAICITLGCYRATEAALKAVVSKSERDWRDFVSAHQSSWPETGGLQVSFTVGHGWNLPLSPPWLVTPDNLFDLSRLLVLGANEFDLQFSRDMSKYLFALAIHPPTPAQLAERRDQYKREQDWKNYLHDLSQSFPSLFTWYRS